MFCRRFGKYQLRRNVIKHIIIYSTIGLFAVNAFAASELTFNSSARPSKLVLGGETFLESDSSTGFNLRYSNGRDVTETSLSRISTSGNTIKVSHPEGKSEFTFRIDTYDNHLAIHLLDAQGIGRGRDYSLSMEFDANNIAAYTLNNLLKLTDFMPRGVFPNGE